ncbi:anaphase-promoting complex subunit 15B [Culicoides brevitarsis]|uniref:anaphase-promoting complex subunit 15B n=1 Tax=Culicoides brevitarsis TaxID=469753 RepID=UPI00307BD177
MSMIPFFPSLMPPTTNSLWFDIDVACDEDSEITALETEHQQWLNSISQTASDLNPLGKTPAEQIDNETDEEDQDANDDDSAESESHDEEEEDDEIEPNGLIIDGSDPRGDYDNPMPMLTNND